MNNVNNNSQFMKKEGNDTFEKKIKYYTQEFVDNATINIPKKTPNSFFTNDIHVTQSYLIKFVKYYLNKTSYQYMKNDTRFDTNKIISKMLKRLPSKSSFVFMTRIMKSPGR